MQKVILLLLISLAISRADIFNCIFQIKDTAPVAMKVFKDIKEKRYNKQLMDVVVDLLQLGNSATDIINKCSNPICLEDAKRRCELQHSNGCEQWGLIMYPKCQSGYNNAACCLCNKQCPQGFKDDGAYCAKPGPYGRGAGYPWQFGDWLFNYDQAGQRCRNDNGECEMDGLIWYAKCKEGYHKVGCCICSPNCPEGWGDIGVSCAKPTYGRGVGYPILYNDCIDMGKRFPFNVIYECNDKLEQMQGPLDNFIKAYQEEKWIQVLIQLGDISDILTSYFGQCYTPQ